MAAADLDFVNDIYDAMLDPRGLHVFTDLIAADLRGASATMELKEADTVSAVITSGIPAKVLESYVQHYYQVNVLLQEALKDMPYGRTTRNSELIPTRVYRNSEFYVDFAKPAEAVKVIGGVVVFDRSQFAAISVHRALSDPDFTDAECRRHQRFLAPAQSALRLRGRLGTGGDFAFEALETLLFGAIVCDRDGRLVFSNSAAEALIREGCGLVVGARSGGIVSAILPDEADRLAHLISLAAEEAHAGAMTIGGATDGRTFLLITPLPRRFGQPAQLVLVTLRQAALSPLAEPAMLAALFGLTAAEANVAAALSAGAGVAEVAAGTGLSHETIRTHVKRCLSKAGAANQREFVALLGRLPPIAGRASSE